MKCLACIAHRAFAIKGNESISQLKEKIGIDGVDNRNNNISIPSPNIFMSFIKGDSLSFGS